jgi:hypothetical protein
MTEDERCREARTFARIDEAFRRGDLDALRAAVDDPSLIPNGRLPVAIGSCLVYAIYHSPLSFVRVLLEAGADANAPADDAFPPLVAAISCARAVAGGRKRTDVDELVRLLLSFGADPNQRGINDYTPLHMAVAERQLLVALVLLDAGANPELTTRIDECESPLQIAEAAGLTAFTELLRRRGQPLRRRLRSGLVLLADVLGDGEPVRRQHSYQIRLRLWLNSGDPVRWQRPWGSVAAATLADDGAMLTTQVRVDRVSLVNGLFYGVEGMRVGGTRRLEISPHLAYGERGVPGVIPPGAVIKAEITILASSAERM